LPCLERTVVADPYDTVRSAAAQGLLALNDRRACGPLRRALSGREPVVGALEALVGLDCVPGLPTRPPRGWTCDPSGCAPPAEGGVVAGPRGRGAMRVVAWWTATGDGGRLLLSGRPIDLVSGAHEGSVDLPERSSTVSITVDPPDRPISIHALVAVPVLP